MKHGRGQDIGTYSKGLGRAALGLTKSERASLLHQSNVDKRQKFAPIVWSEQREMLDAMRQFRAAMALGEADAARRHRHLAGQVSGDPVEDVRAAREAAWYARSLALADAYIERLARAISERPQGKGGWQVVALLEKMYAEFAAHHDNPPAGMAVEVEPRAMPAAESIVSETLFSKD